MQQPFAISDEMKAELDAELTKIAPPRDRLLLARETTHGPYLQVAEYSQHLKTVFRSHVGYGNLTAVQRESIDLMCTKFARALCGNPDHKDHWDDLAGYAKLVAETL